MALDKTNQSVKHDYVVAHLNDEDTLVKIKVRGETYVVQFPEDGQFPRIVRWQKFTEKA